MPISCKHLAGVTLNSMRWHSFKQINRNHSVYQIHFISTLLRRRSRGDDTSLISLVRGWGPESVPREHCYQGLRNKDSTRAERRHCFFKAPFNCVLWLQKHSPIYPVDIILQIYRRECSLLMSPEVPTLSPYLISLFTLTGFPEFKREK